MINIFTDGSHLDKQNNGRLGCGGVMISNDGKGFGKILDEFSQELKPQDLQRELGTDKVSNPTAELLGLLTALKKFNIPKGEDVTIYADYIGVKSWMEGTWKIKEPYIKKVKEQIDKEIAKKNLKGRIHYAWVKGHQGKRAVSVSSEAYWNEYVDHLAKGLC